MTNEVWYVASVGIMDTHIHLIMNVGITPLQTLTLKHITQTIYTGQDMDSAQHSELHNTFTATPSTTGI